jgi:uncharacterized membrane protein YfcA
MAWHRKGRRRFLGFVAFCLMLVIVGPFLQSRIGPGILFVAVLVVVLTLLVSWATRGVGRGRSSAPEVEDPYAASAVDDPH